MSRAAVKAYCARQLALLTVPVPCAVVTQRPKEIALGEQAVISVELAQSRERRFTSPRGYGRKQIDHRVRVAVWWVAAEETAGGGQFDALLDQIDALFRGCGIDEPLIDPDTGAQSVLVLLGEEIETAVDEPVLDESLQGMVVFSAVKELAASEQVQG